MNRRLIVSLLLAAACLQGQAKLPPYTKQTLPNGATLILLKKPDVPLVSVRAIFRGGVEAEPANLTGIAALTAELVRRGTPTRSSEQVSLDLDSIGANLNGGSDRQASFLFTEYMARTQDRALEIFSDVLLHPSFPEPEVKKVVAQAADRLRSIKDNPGAAIGRYYEAFYYPAAHPYHRSGSVTEESLTRLTRDEIIAFHKKNYTGKNLILIAAGDFDPAKLGPVLAKLAGELPAGPEFQPGKFAAPKFDSARLLLVDKPDATQTYFEIGMPGIDRTNRDRVPLMVLNTLFGGRFTSMLNDALRVNSGLTYGARSILEQDRHTGSIIISTYTRTDTTEKAVDMALDVLKKLSEQGIDAAQLASAKAYIKGGFPTQRLETADQLASVIGEMEIYGLNKGEIDDYFSRIDAISLEEANVIAKKYYRDLNLQFCLLGNASKIQDSVKKYAPKMKVLSIKEPGFDPPSF
ncbi:M16 family metallopeptidase [Paludibaculum fermentans]|uniref:Insulinase family protein n=1 Tax=Paludibaculum fermentans TaxID=1473598 RepID=A0A7S7NVS1_PALFE|nr:pitrilysin family protein [Paludibaculum fermentans]QOY90089.1 insulinase family protein [Paludibaculum fermentans]